MSPPNHAAAAARAALEQWARSGRSRWAALMRGHDSPAAAIGRAGFKALTRWATQIAGVTPRHVDRLATAIGTTPGLWYVTSEEMPQIVEVVRRLVLTGLPLRLAIAAARQARDERRSLRVFGEEMIFLYRALSPITPLGRGGARLWREFAREMLARNVKPGIAASRLAEVHRRQVLEAASRAAKLHGYADALEWLDAELLAVFDGVRRVEVGRYSLLLPASCEAITAHGRDVQNCLARHHNLVIYLMRGAILTRVSRDGAGCGTISVHVEVTKDCQGVVVGDAVMKHESGDFDLDAVRRAFDDVLDIGVRQRYTQALGRVYDAFVSEFKQIRNGNGPRLMALLHESNKE